MYLCMYVVILQAPVCMYARMHVFMDVCYDNASTCCVYAFMRMYVHIFMHVFMDVCYDTASTCMYAHVCMNVCSTGVIASE